MNPYLAPVVELGEVALQFGLVHRITRHADELDGAPGPHETDTTHTVMLGLVACALAHQMDGSLDLGRVAQYATVHDLVEVHAGDTNSLEMPTAERVAEKKVREERALVRLRVQFGGTLPWLVEAIVEYERQRTREARWVKAVDKLLPKITHLLNEARVLREQGLTEETLRARYAVQYVEMQRYAAEWPALLKLRTDLIEQVVAVWHAANVEAPDVSVG